MARQERTRAEAALQEVSDRTRDLEARETALTEDRVVLEEARGAFESERREFQDRTAQYEDELRRRRADLDGQAKEIGEHQLRIAQDKELYEATRNEKNQAILSREIEVEAREQSVAEKEEAIRAQAEDNARRLVDQVVRLQPDLSQRDIGVLVGLSHQRVYQLRTRQQQPNGATRRPPTMRGSSNSSPKTCGRRCRWTPRGLPGLSSISVAPRD